MAIALSLWTMYLGQTYPTRVVYLEAEEDICVGFFWWFEYSIFESLLSLIPC